MDDPLLPSIIILILLIFVNAFFAAAEIAVISLNEAVIRHQAEEGDKKAARLLHIVEQPTGFLSTIQIGITLAGFLGSAFAADNLAGRLSQWFAAQYALTAAAEAAVKMVNDNRLAKRVTYITFSRHAMEELIRLAPKNDVLYLGGDISPEELEAMGAAGGDYNHGVYLRNPSWLAYMKEHKMVSNVWTVNHPVDMIWAIEQQIDFLTTDRPDLFLELVR